MKSAMLLFLVKHDGIYRSEFLTRFGGNDNYQVFTELLQDGYLRLEGCIESFPYDGLTWDSKVRITPQGRAAANEYRGNRRRKNFDVIVGIVSIIGVLFAVLQFFK